MLWRAECHDDVQIIISLLSDGKFFIQNNNEDSMTLNVVSVLLMISSRQYIAITACVLMLLINQKVLN